MQWALAYVAGAFALLQGADIVAQQFAWPESVRRGITLALVLGFFVTLVLAWYHGERGAQKISGVELLLLALLLAVGGGLIWRFAGVSSNRISADANPARVPTASAMPMADSKSIAVLPLVNASGDDKQQFFSDGISESLIIALSQVPGLTVIGRNSSFQFRDGNADSRSIGEKLGVARLLGGSVQHAGDMVRISVELVDAPTGRALWSQRYDRQYADLFKLQDDITAAVAGVLKSKLLGDAQTAQSDRPASGNIEAYNALLEANFQMAKLTEEGSRRAIDLLDRAIELDPGYALAYAKRASAWTFPLAWNDAAVARRLVAKSPARADVQHALTLNPNLAYAHAVAGHLSGYVDVDPVVAEAEYRRALALQPDQPAATTGLSRLMSQTGRYPEAIDLVRRALLSDPLSAVAYAQLARLLQLTGQLDESKAAFDKILELLPDAPGVKANFVWLAITRGDAEAAMRTALALPPGKFRDDSLAFAAQIGTDRASADVALREFIASQGANNPSGVAEMYALRNEPGPMFEWLRRALDAGDPSAKWLWEDPYYVRYRDDPRFAAYCREAGVPTPAEVEAANAAYLAKREGQATAHD
ncbi:MAG TPA: tetratricopeptide repeat protein [Rhodanobacteraceae bacterium]|nr:tetratricopeptide repeat protein [Rhodanobacteraceae bacterium]